MFLSRKYLISGIILFLGVGVSFILYLSLKRANEVKRDEIHSGVFDAISLSIQREIDFNINSLYAIRADYLAHEGFNHTQFNSFTDYYIDNIASIQALEWVPTIYLAQRDSFELAMREIGFKDFQIFTIKEGERVRAEDRDVYYPVSYVNPFGPNKAAVGFDPGASSATRQNAILKSIESKKVAVSDVINIIQKTDPHKAVLVFVPVFLANGQLDGLVEGVYLTQELIEFAVADLEFTESILISIKDEGDDLVYGKEPDGKLDYLTGNVYFGDRSYKLRLDFVADLGSDLLNAQLLFITCLIITFFIVGIIYYSLARSERQHKRSRASIESIFKLSENPIALFDTNLKLKEWNESFSKLIDGLQDRSPRINMNMPKQFNKEDQGLRDKILRGEQVKSTQSLKIGGDKKHVVLNYLPISDGGIIVGACILIQDITAIKKYEVALETYSLKLEEMVDQRTIELDHSNKELIKRNKELSNALDELRLAQEELVQSRKMASLGVISAGVGHEINNPLNFIIGGVTVLERALSGQLNSEQERAIENIKIGAQRASEIVKTIGRFSRKSMSLTESCDIHAILEGCLLMMSHSLKEKVTIEKQYSSEELIAQGNEGMLHQAFLNILMNAEQAIDKEGKIKIQTNIKDGVIQVMIYDTGMGIDPDDLHKIMDPFYSTKAPGKGVGLGLFMTYNIINDMGGKMEFQSEPGTGTLCIISLKLADEV